MSAGDPAAAPHWPNGRGLHYWSAIPGPPGRLLPLWDQPTHSHPSATSQLREKGPSTNSCPPRARGHAEGSEGPRGGVGDRTEHLCPSLRPNPGLGWPAQLRGRQQARPNPHGRPARVMTTTPRAQAPPDPGTGKSGAGDGWGRECGKPSRQRQGGAWAWGRGRGRADG